MEFLVKEFEELTTLELYKILGARAQIFIVEKKMNCQDIDGVDFSAKHFMIMENGNIIAYLRGFFDDEAKKIFKLGRILSLTHGKGHGRILMEKSIEHIKNNIPSEMIYINAQAHAIKFYEKFGFEVCSDEFLEEGIVHRRMELKTGETN